jgi:glucose-6-phosphate isomerase
MDANFAGNLPRRRPTAPLTIADPADDIRTPKWEAWMLFPEGVAIDGATGAVTPATGRYVKRLSALRDLYAEPAAVDAFIAEHGDVTAYEVIEYRPDGSDICFGTTIMAPGKIGTEYFLTRGHYHAKSDRGETYYTQSGEGLLLLHARSGEARVVAMRPGICAFIPPDWAHRSVNTGSVPLVFVWMCAVDAGHDYGEVATRGMRQRAVERDGQPTVVDNPNF